MGTRIKFTQLGQFEKALGAEFPRAMKLGLGRVGKNAVAILKRRTRTCAPASANGSIGAVAEGTFLKGWKWRRVGTDTVVVQNDAPHAVYVEEGRRPGAPPPPTSALIPWIRRKFTNLKGRDERGRYARAQDTEAIYARLAFVIARAIGRRGLRGRHILRDAQEALRLSAQSTLNRAFAEALSKAGRK